MRISAPFPRTRDRSGTQPTRRRRWLLVPVILLMILGVAMTAGLKWVERRIAPWSRAEA